MNTLLNERGRALRQYLFREMVASHDAQVCRSGAGPMILTWSQARDFWRKATNGALSHKWGKA